MKATWVSVLMMVSTLSARAQTVQIITGRVLGDSAAPLAGAVVSVTMAPDRTFRQDTTRADGRWRFAFERASGDYLVHIAAPGRQSFRKRVTAPPSDTVVTVDATLARTVQQLATVRVEARRPKPSRDNGSYTPDDNSAEIIPAGVNGAVSADMQGDLAALAANIPGLALTPGGVSAFGLDPSQNGVTVNGLSFPGASLPRNAVTTTRFTTSAYDPSRGGFSGVETAVTLSPGNINTYRRGNLTLDAPQLQASDRIGRQLGQRIAAGRASLGSSGTIVEDAWYYNASADVSRRVADAPTIVGADAGLLALVGVAPDSAARFLQSLATLRIPATLESVPRQRVDDYLSFAVRLDHAPYKPQSFTPSEKTWALVGIGRVDRSDGQGSSPTSTQARGARSLRALGVVQAIYSTFVDEYSLSETRTAFSVSHSSGTPYLRLPSGDVLVSSQTVDGATNSAFLSFGGNSARDLEETQWGWETRSDYQWFARGVHRMKVTAQSKVDGYQQHAPSNALGTFTFASLADLAANRPSSFSRTIGEPDRSGAAWTGFLAVGDQWRKTPRLQLVYGARIEANRFLTGPALNTDLERALGVSTDVTPSHLHISPRLGFSWRFGGDGSGFNGFSISNIGTRIMAPSGLLRGGIGEFRGAMPTQLLAGPMVRTGLPGGARAISCIGQAVPIPDWSMYADDPTRIPVSCVGGGSPLFTDAAPLVQTIDREFDAPRSWRANLGVMTVRKNIGLSLDGNVSVNLNQASVVDRNFAGVSRFRLVEEGRDVFTTASSIVPATGVLSAVEARRSAAFGPVMSRTSDLRSLGRQLTLTVSPQAIGSYLLDFAYTLSSTHGDVRGFSSAAFSDPRVVEQARTDFDVRHRFQIQAGKSLPKGFSLNMALVATSGMPYTPVVNGDVNGDGLARDRAFIVDPAQTADASYAQAMRALLVSAPAHSRSCLAAQIGRAAGYNSCEGPWNATATGRLGIANATGPWGRRVNASLSLSNPLGGLDQLLHGESSMHGWGMAVAPDPVLLAVRGFDPAAAHFRYDVNPRFGSTSPQQNVARVPFRITLDVSFDLGPSTARQQLERVLNRGRAGHPGEKLSADSIRARFSRNTPSPYLAIIREADSLLLSREQVEELRAGDARFKRVTDSLWLALGRELAVLPDTYDAAWATQRTEDITDQAWELARLEVASIKRILTPLQFSLAPGAVRYLDTVKGKVQIRMYMY